MIYTGLGRVGEIADVKANGGSDVSEVYGGIGDSNPIYYKQRDMVGTSPMQFKALGLPLKDYRISGETLQDGTPSPDMPVDVVGCGVRTENLFDDAILQNNKGLDFSGSVTDFDGRVTTGEPIDVSNTSAVTLKFTGTGINFIYATFKSGILVERVSGKYTGDVIRTSDCDELYICFYSTSAITKDDISNIMLTTGSTALPYEPYGYKIPVTIGNTTTPIYIGSDPLYRIGDYADEVDFGNQRIIRRVNPTTMQPYETPITSTATIPELTAVFGDNTLTVDTAVKPSAVSITGNIKPTGYGQLLDVNDVDIKDSNGTPIFVHG